MQNHSNKGSVENPALTSLGVLVGGWTTVGKHPYLGDMVLHGTTSFKWLEGGAFLLMHSENAEEKIPASVAIFGTDNSTDEIFMLYFDERKVSRKYDVSFEGSVLKSWRIDPDFSQSFTWKLSDDGNSIIGQGQMCRDGKTWKKDLELTYTRIS